MGAKNEKAPTKAVEKESGEGNKLKIHICTAQLLCVLILKPPLKWILTYFIFIFRGGYSASLNNRSKVFFQKKNKSFSCSNMVIFVERKNKCREKFNPSR
jgi:hypothetical protein